MPEAPRTDQLAGRLAELRAGLEDCDPHVLARNTAAVFHSATGEAGVFRLDYWDRPVEIDFPALAACDPDTGGPLPDFVQAMLLYYFSTSDGAPTAGKWISFSELPDGRFYSQAFQGYTGRELAGVFHGDLDGFTRAAAKLAGEHISLLGDAAYRIQALPLVPLLVVAWLGDEDFQPAYQILFDANVSHHLPTDACAVLGSTLTGRLIRAKLETPYPLSPNP